MKTCPNCKAIGIPDEATFCPQCGISLLSDSEIKKNHVLRVYNAISYLGKCNIQVFRNGKDVGDLKKGESLDVEIQEDCIIIIKYGMISKEFTIKYDKPGALVVHNDLRKTISIIQCESNGVDHALSIAADDSKKRNILLMIIALVILCLWCAILYM